MEDYEKLEEVGKGTKTNILYPQEVLEKSGK
jgi:hypothetical protein